MKEEFKNPSNIFRAKPFWAWNGELEESEIKRQVDILKEMGFGGFFMHSRVGLKTEYLGKDWFDIINSCADYAEKQGLEAWLYDEDRWPSGSAGGKACIKYENRMKFIRVNEGTPDWNRNIIAAFSCRLEGINVYDVKRIYQNDTNEKNTIWFDIVEYPEAPTYNSTAYLDTMKSSATDEFIKLTHQQYSEKCGDRLGKSIKGIFTDEPHRGEIMTDTMLSEENIAAWTPYTDSLFDDFQTQWGYDLRDKLPQLFFRENGETVAQVKWHYCETIQKLFLDNFMKPIAKWCNENNMIFTGHMLHENTLSSQAIVNGSLMRSYEVMGYPGVDVLGLHNENYNIVKQLSSAAHQTSKKWLLSELYGCSGWQMNFEDLKRVGDWQALFGINLRCPHLSWYTMSGQRKRDYPASIFYQSAWYKEYKYIEDYFARLSVFMNAGENACNTLVINPVESMWCRIHKGWAKWLVTTSEKCLEAEEQYKDLYDMLLADNVEYDYGDEEMMSRLAHTENGVLYVGKAKYTQVIVSGMVTMRSTTYHILQDFEKQGGKVIVLGGLPHYIDALPEKVQLGNADYADILNNRLVAVNNKKIFSSVKSDNNGILYIMLLNMDYKNMQSGKFTTPYGRYEEYNPLNGETKNVKNPDTIIMQAGEMRLYKVYLNENPYDEEIPKEYKQITLTHNFQYETDEPNVLVIDRTECRYKNKIIADEVLRIDSTLRDECGIERRNGNMYQPWYQKEIGISKYFDIELRYSFNSEIETDGYISLEQGERSKVYFNQELVSTDNSYWIDPCMKKYKVHIQKGENTILIKTYFADDTDIEAVYVLGNFGVYNGIIKEKPTHLNFGDITKQGFEFYGGKIKYIFNQTVKETSLLKLNGLCGSAVIKVNGNLIIGAPYKAVLEPCEKITIELVLTRRNTFGPFHLYPMEDSASPRSFVTEGNRWTDKMMLIPCGLKK